jgi:hypothetical protein
VLDVIIFSFVLLQTHRNEWGLLSFRAVHVLRHDICCAMKRVPQAVVSS